MGVGEANEGQVPLGAPNLVGGIYAAGNGGSGQVFSFRTDSAGQLLVAASVSIAANSPINVAQVNGVTVLTGTGVVGTGAQRVAVGVDAATVAGSAPGTAGTASANVVTVQGIASMTKLLVTPDSVALPANQSVNVSQMNGVATSMGTGAIDTGTQRVVLATASVVNVTDGTTTANVSPGTGSQTGQAALQVAATNQVQAFSFSGATNGTAYDISGYKSISVQILGNASANTLTFQTSNDASAPTNWTSLSMIVADGSAGGAVSSTYALTVLKTLQATVCARFFRVICSSFIGGTTTGTLLFSTMPISSLYMGQAGTWTMQPGNIANTTAWLQSLRPSTSGGNTPFWIDNLNATVIAIKASAGQLYNIQLDNSQAATACFVQIFNIAAGSVVLGTSNPVLEYYVPGASVRTISFGDIGTVFGTAISIASTTLDKGSVGSANGVIVSGSFN